jgi:hypothetical protein
MTFIRFLDLALIVFALPLIVAADAPLIGYGVGAAGWLTARLSGEVLDRRAQRVDPRTGIGLRVAGMMGRAWIVAVAVVVASLVGERRDAVAAALLALAAFTVYFALSIAFQRNATRP